MRAFLPRLTAKLRASEKLAWVKSAPVWLPSFVGVMEILGAIGLILPVATQIAPQLTPLAALHRDRTVHAAPKVRDWRDRGATGEVMP